MGLCYSHRNNQPMLRALAYGLNSRNQKLCAAFCKELDALNGQGELVENLDWRASRRIALLSSLKNRHFRQFYSSGWISSDAIAKQQFSFSSNGLLKLEGLRLRDKFKTGMQLSGNLSHFCFIDEN
ncbi:hypothetical protein ACOME3_000850 [Neoechinorhynchus agilis]